MESQNIISFKGIKLFIVPIGLGFTYELISVYIWLHGEPLAGLNLELLWLKQYACDYDHIYQIQKLLKSWPNKNLK